MLNANTQSSRLKKMTWEPLAPKTKLFKNICTLLVKFQKRSVQFVQKHFSSFIAKIIIVTLPFKNSHCHYETIFYKQL